MSYRISGIGLHPDLMESYPQILNYSASFVAQNQEAVLFVNQYRQAHELDTLTDITPEQAVDPAPLLVMLEQCEDIVATVRKRIYKTGISIRLTNMMLRLDQSLQRMRILTELVTDDNQKRDRAVIELIQALITTANQRYSIGYLIDNNTKLLSRKVTENASRVGEHYISTDKAGYQKMLKKSLYWWLYHCIYGNYKNTGVPLSARTHGSRVHQQYDLWVGFRIHSCYSRHSRDQAASHDRSCDCLYHF